MTKYYILTEDMEKSDYIGLMILSSFFCFALSVYIFCTLTRREMYVLEIIGLLFISAVLGFIITEPFLSKVFGKKYIKIKDKRAK